MNSKEKKDEAAFKRLIFLFLGEELLKLYERLPQNNSKRKIIICSHDESCGNCLMLFQGTKEDCFAVQEFLNKRKKK